MIPLNLRQRIALSGLANGPLVRQRGIFYSVTGAACCDAHTVVFLKRRGLAKFDKTRGRVTATRRGRKMAARTRV
jgi:hypothetical protein